MKRITAENLILDTLKFKNKKIIFRKQHIERVFETYIFLNISFAEENVEKIYSEIEIKYAEQVDDDSCLRILFSEKNINDYKVEIRLIEKLDPPLKLFVLKADFDFSNRHHSYKWFERSRWKNLLADMPEGADDILLINKQNYLVETSRCNLFLYDILSDLVYTPSIDSGCLNGVFRRYVVSNKMIELPGYGLKKIVEQELPISFAVRLSESTNDRYVLFAGNSIRGLLPAIIL